MMDVTESRVSFSSNNANSRDELCTEKKIQKEENDQANKSVRTNKLATTDGEALIHVVKASLGSGVLAMPVAYKNAGLLEGLIGTIIIGIICTHGTHLLVKSSQKMCDSLKINSLGYAETVEAVFKTSPHLRIQSKAKFVKSIVNIFLFVTYFGSNTVYAVIVAASIQEVMNNQFGIFWSVRWFLVLCTVPLLLVGTVRSMKYLVPFSILANILLSISLVIIFYYVCQDLPPLDSRPYWVNLTKFPLFLATVISGLEGIGTILPIENSMRNPKHFLSFPGVLSSAMSIVVVLFTTVGFFGYLKYGDNAKGSISLNLPPDYTAEIIKLLVGLAILFTFGLQMTAVTEVLWNSIENKIKEENRNSAYYVTRGSLVLLTVLCGIAVPQLAPVISLIGAVGFSTLGLFIPAMIDTITLSDKGLDLSGLNVWKNFFMMVLAMFALITGSYSSILDIIQQYS